MCSAFVASVASVVVFKVMDQPLVPWMLAHFLQMYFSKLGILVRIVFFINTLTATIIEFPRDVMLLLFLIYLNKYGKNIESITKSVFDRQLRSYIGYAF